MLKIIDVDNKGYASKEDIQGMTLEQLKQIANEVDGDPANTEEYEFALFEIDSVRYLRDTILWFNIHFSSILLSDFGSVGTGSRFYSHQVTCFLRQETLLGSKFWETADPPLP